MPELRHDAISGRSVIVAIERAARPFTFPTKPSGTGEPADCPFCAGREEMTPPEVHRTGPGDAETEGWRVRVVPNLYPLVGPAEPHDPARVTGFGEEHGAIPIAGAHEVVVLSPDHYASFGTLDDDAATEVLTVIRDRVRFHLDAGHAYVQAFVNHGRAAGASIEHPHAQLVALDVVPAAVAAGVERLATTDLVAREIAEARRDELVIVDGPAPGWSPFAAWVPYGMRVAHRSTRARFDEATDAEVRVVALGLRDALARLHAALGDAPYNAVVRSAPPGRVAGEFHWHVDVLPRTTLLAGFEEGTGILVNTVPPELAALRLRDASAP
jgi:UDPglucose--hexose-1-phosphate uridylyltransferase